MKDKNTVRTLKRVGLSLLVAGVTLYAGGCSTLPGANLLGSLFGGLIPGFGA